MILYFSGTGNSKFAAELIAGETGEKIISLNEKLKAKDFSPVSSNEKLIFVLPTYAWRIPKVICDWVEKTEFPNGRYAYFVMTCGGEIGNAGKYNRLLCKKKGFIYMGSMGVLMPDNYIVMFPEVKKDEKEEKLSKAVPKIKEIAQMIAETKTLPKNRNNLYDKSMSFFVNRMFYKNYVLDKAFYTSDNCTACGKCMRECPLSNISMAQGKPKWNGSCTHCMRCISICPVASIEYGKKTAGKKRYLLEDKED